MPIEFGTGLEVVLEQPGMPTFQLPSPQAPTVALVAVTGPAGEGVATLGPRVDELELQVDALEIATGGDPPPLAYLHTQTAPATVWLISHPLSFVPAGVEVFDHTGARHYPVLSYPDPSTVRCDFMTTVRGTARLS